MTSLERPMGPVRIIHSDARTIPLPDESVDLIITSPPYWALRSYQDAGEHYAGQLGSEDSPTAYVDGLLEVTAELVRLLKPTGSLFVNIGDKYGTGDPTSSTPSQLQGGKRFREAQPSKITVHGVRHKSLAGIPWRYAIRCMDELGLVLRAEVIWEKPNGLPESVTDRVWRQHEQVFHFTKGARYFATLDEIRTPHLATSLARIAMGYQPTKRDVVEAEHNGPLGTRGAGGWAEGYDPNPLGRLPGSVWRIPTESLRIPTHLGDHFAAFPTELPRRIVLGWSPAGICLECGEGRKLATVRGPAYDAWRKAVGGYNQGNDPAVMGKARSVSLSIPADVRAAGYRCACETPEAPTTPAVVLDPFGGTGTTAMVARALGRAGISVDMSADYCRTAHWRTHDRNELAHVLGLGRLPAPDPEQLSLLEEVAHA